MKNIISTTVYLSVIALLLLASPSAAQPLRSGSSSQLYIPAPPSLPPQSFSAATVGRPVSGTISAAGGSAPISYAVTSGALPSGVSLSTGGALSGSPSQSGSFNFTVTATDNASQTDSRSYSLTVNPAVAITPLPTAYGVIGQLLTVTPSVSGGTGPITWSMNPFISGFSTSTGVFAATPVGNGTVPVTLTATDANGSTDSKSYNIIIAPVLTISANAPPGGIVGSPYTHTVTAAGGRTPYSFSNSTPLPAGLSLASNGTISGTPTAAGSTSFSVTVTDANTTTANTSVTINVIAGVSLSATGLTPITVGGPATASIQASGGQGGPFTFSLTSGSLPPGLSMASSGAITGTATTAGTATFSVTATGAGSLTGTQSFNWVVNPAITLSVGASNPSTVGIALNRSLTASGGTGNLTFSISAGTLPPGVSLSGTAISGTFTTAGTYNYTVRATDSTGAFNEQSLSQLVNPPVSIQGDSLPNGWPGRFVSSSLAPSGGTAPYTFQIASGALPPGISLSSNGAISGSFSTAGSYAFTVRLSDSVGSQDSRSFNVTVRPGMSLRPTGTLPPATLGAPFEVSLGAITQAGSVTFSIGASSLPPGLSFNGASISGVPTAAGSYSFGFQATTSDGETASTDLSLIVNPALQFTVPPTQTIYVGKPMSWVPSLSGGTPPLLVRLLGVSLPSGFTLDSTTGVISGTPTAPGRLEFTVEATDANAARVQRFVSLQILVPVQITTALEPVYPLNQSVSVPLTASNGTAPYTFRLASGALPDGLQLGGGLLTGAPSKPGAFTFTLQATDQTGSSVERTYKVLVSSGFTLSSSKLQFLAQPGQTSARQTLKLDSNPAGVPVTLSGAPSWLKSSLNTSATPGAVDFWVELPANAETGESIADVVFRSAGLPEQTLTVALRAFKASDATLTADFISSGSGQHTVSLRAQLPEVPFEASLEGPGAISYQLSASSGIASSSGAFGLLISPSANPTVLSLDTTLVIRNGLTSETLKFPLPTGGIPAILLSNTDLSLTAASGDPTPVEAELFVRSQSGARRYATTVDTPWLTVTPATGPLDPAARLALRIDPALLSSGDNNALVTIYLEDGRPAATLRVLIALAPTDPQPTVDQFAFVFTPAKATATLQVSNPTSRVVPFALRSSLSAIEANVESGQLAPKESRTVQISARPFTATQSLFVSFGDGVPAVIDLVWLAAQPNCEPKPTIAWLAPARGAALPSGVSAKVQALLTNGCGSPLTQGSLSLLSSDGPALSLLHSGDGIWSTQWRATATKTIELLYLSPDGLRQSRQTLSVDVK